MKNSLIKSSAILSLALFLGRISGLVREWLLSFKLGFFKEIDIAILLLSFPDFITNLLLAGGFNTAFIPLLKQHSPTIAKKIFLRMLLYVGSIATLISLLLFFFPKIWILLFAPGVNLHINEIKIPLLITLISVPFAMMSCVFTAYLNANNKFFISGLGTFIFNFCIIVLVLICFKEKYLLIFLALGILGGSLLRFIAQHLNQPYITIKVDTKENFIDCCFIKNFLLASFCSSITIMTPFLARMACSFFEEGQIAIFNYANKFIEIPLGLFITNIGIVLYPLLCSSDNKKKKYYETIALQKTLYFSFLFLMLGLIFGKDLLQFIYQHGKCSEKNIEDLYNALKCLLFLLPFAAIDTIFSFQLNANNRIKQVWYSSLIALISFISLEVIAIQTRNCKLLYFGMVLFYLCRSFLLIQFGNSIIFFTRSFVKNSVLILLISIFCAYFRSYMSSLYLKLLIGGICGSSLLIHIYKINFDDEKII